jgi:hypothetical protein
MHTPRLCIDGRGAAEFAAQGILAQEWIDQLVSAQGEPDLGNEWIDRQRTVLLTHPDQVFSGQLRRFDTKRKIGRSPLYGWWERKFVQNAHLSAFHRFRPADRLSPTLKCPTITTVLPAKFGFRPFRTQKEGQRFLVPSARDKAVLENRYRVAEEMIFIIRPGLRRYVHFASAPRRAPGNLLFVVDERPRREARRLMKILSDRYPNSPKKILRLGQAKEFAPTRWLKTLEQTQLCVYLSHRQFDWPTLALEAIYWEVPTLFFDTHSALDELLPSSPLRLSKFLVHHPTLAELSEHVGQAKAALEREGTFDPFRYARQLRQIYSGMEVAVD